MVLSMTSQNKVVDLLMQHIQVVNSLQKDRYGNLNFYAVVEWVRMTHSLLVAIYGEENKHTLDYMNVIGGIPTQDEELWIRQTVNMSKAILRSNINEILTRMENP
jgi:hypothetical protein